jgi:hypothetical protein
MFLWHKNDLARAVACQSRRIAAMIGPALMRGASCRRPSDPRGFAEPRIIHPTAWHGACIVSPAVFIAAEIFLCTDVLL